MRSASYRRRTYWKARRDPAPGDFRRRVMTLRVRADIGGTFTDLVLVSDDGSTFAFGKVLTTPLQPDDAVVDGMQALLDGTSADRSQSATVVHGTTLFTNALIERKGAKTAPITTRARRPTPSARACQVAALTRQPTRAGPIRRGANSVTKAIPTTPSTYSGRVDGSGTSMTPLQLSPQVDGFDVVILIVTSIRESKFKWKSTSTVPNRPG